MTGLEIAPLALGTWTFGWSVDESHAHELLSAAMYHGCNVIDTADRYGRPTSPVGTAESYIGNWLKSQQRDELIIATKIRGRMGPGLNNDGLSRKYLHRAVDASLRRLRTDYIDVLQLHWPDPRTPLEETLRAVDDLVHQGKVRYMGCSNFPGWMLVQCLWIADLRGWAPVVSTQVQYSLVHRAEYERDLMEVALGFGLGVFAYSPLAEGFLSGKYRRSLEPAAEARLTSRPEVARFLTDRNYETLQVLEEVASSRKVSPSQVALAWTVAQPGITAAVIGARSVEQLAENFGACQIALTPAESSSLAEASSWVDERTPLARGVFPVD